MIFTIKVTVRVIFILLVMASCVSVKNGDFFTRKYLRPDQLQTVESAQCISTLPVQIAVPKDSVKTLVYDCPGDTIRLTSGREVVADVLGIGFTQIHFRKKKPTGNVQHLKLKYIDTVHWDGYVQQNKKAFAIDTALMAERDVVQKHTTGKKQIFYGVYFIIMPVYSIAIAALSTMASTGVATVALFYWFYLVLVPVGLVLLFIGLSRWIKARKAVLK